MPVGKNRKLISARKGVAIRRRSEKRGAEKRARRFRRPPGRPSLRSLTTHRYAAIEDETRKPLCTLHSSVTDPLNR